MEAIVNPPSRGSRLDADHPQNGGLIPCRFTLELDPTYVDTIIRRWQALTGGSARHAASGRSFDDLACEAEAADAA
jgi:hypothetical protein